MLVISIGPLTKGLVSDLLCELHLRAWIPFHHTRNSREGGLKSPERLQTDQCIENPKYVTFSLFVFNKKKKEKGKKGMIAKGGPLK